jgi:tetratricopeptide (TPR) repeat protein
MVDLWNHHPLRVVAFLLPSLYVVARTAQFLLQYRRIKREGLRGNFVAQIVGVFLFSLMALALCVPGLLTAKELGYEGDDSGVAVVPSGMKPKGSPLPSEVRFKGPLTPARDAILKEDWASLARTIFDVRSTSGEFQRDTDFLLSHFAPQLGKQYVVLGRAAVDRGDTTLARRYLDFAADLVPDEPDAFLLRAVAAPPDEWRGALKDFDLAIRRCKPGDPRLVDATERRLALRLAHGDSRGALEDVDVLLALRPADAARLAQRGELRLSVGAVDGAIADLASACAAAPRDSGLRLELANARLKRDDSPEQVREALADLNKVIASGADSSRVRYLRGQVQLALKNPSEALGDASRAIALDPKSADAYFLRGRARLELDQAIAARSDFNQAIQLNPDHRAAHFWRGFVLRERDPKNALADFTRAYELEADPWALYYRAGCLLALGRRDEAETAYSDALTLAHDPQVVELINKGLARAKSLRKH